ncbi:MAG: nucleotidyltransferase family protein [Bryobacterales bacterium]|nr:nucleotidyltransferase family protein [Bryobacterales bacterium]
MTKAIVLAAGRGTRMGALTERVAKPMLELSGKPILEHLLDRLRAAGFDRALIVTGYQGEAIESRFASYPMDLQFRRQVTLDGTGSATLLGEEFAGGDPFLLTFGDTLAGAACYAGILESLRADVQCQAMIGVKETDDPWQGAAVYEQGGRVVRVVEKPPRGSSSTPWNSAGLFAFRPAIFPALRGIGKSARGEYELTGGYQKMMQEGSLVRLYVVEGPWASIGRPEDIEKTIGTW